MYSETITNDPLFQKAFKTKEKKEVFLALSIVEDFLPKDSSSPWPKEPRKMYNRAYNTTLLAAWNGTMGASAAFGPRMKRFLAPFNKSLAGLNPSQRNIFEKLEIGSGGMLDVQVIVDIRQLKELLFRYGYRIWYHIKFGETFYNLLGQDLLRLIAIAKRCNTDYIQLFQVHELEGLDYSYQMLTFGVKGIGIHILTIPEFDVKD